VELVVDDAGGGGDDAAPPPLAPAHAAEAPPAGASPAPAVAAPAASAPDPAAAPAAAPAEAVAAGSPARPRLLAGGVDGACVGSPGLVDWARVREWSGMKTLASTRCVCPVPRAPPVTGACPKHVSNGVGMRRGCVRPYSPPPFPCVAGPDRERRASAHTPSGVPSSLGVTRAARPARASLNLHAAAEVAAPRCVGGTCVRLA
jgi:hypothetical protein